MAKVEFTIQQVGPWPGELTKSRRESAFKAGYTATLGTLKHEILMLQRESGTVAAVIGLAVREQDIRVDGQNLKADAKFDHPGVLVAFPSKHGPLKYYVDCFTHWRDNVRAVALTLERLRMADLYGATRRGEQYRGFKALPDPNGGLVTPPPMTVEEAAKFLAAVAGSQPWTVLIEEPVENYRDAYRFAAKKLHPDARTGPSAPTPEGIAADWQKLQEIKSVLDRHHESKGGAR